MANKYHAVKTIVDGITFDSKREAQRYEELRLLEKAGEISELIVHPRYELEKADRMMCLRAINYIGDFQYREDNHLVCEDVKGVQTAVFKMKANLFHRYYKDIELRIVK